MKRPTEEQIDIAREWLRSNEGDGEEGEACRAVEAWLTHLKTEHTVGMIARSAGVPRSKARAHLMKVRAP